MANTKTKNSTEISGMRQRTHKGVDKIMDKAESMKENGEEAVENLKEKIKVARENVDGYIRKNPEKSVLIAAGIGAVAGALIAAAIMRRKNQ